MIRLLALASSIALILIAVPSVVAKENQPDLIGGGEAPAGWAILPRSTSPQAWSSPANDSAASTSADTPAGGVPPWVGEVRDAHPCDGKPRALPRL